MTTTLIANEIGAVNPQALTAETNVGTPPTPPPYATTLLTHWAEAVVDGPIKNIARYDEVAKLLALLVAPVLTALLALYEKAGGILAMKPTWLLILLFVLFIGSIVGVVVCVVRVCNERLRLIINNPACGRKKLGLISYLLEDADELSRQPSKLWDAIEEWERHVEKVADCKHKWLKYAVWCFVAGSLIPFVMLALTLWPAGGPAQ
jgi:hypothetical protein